MTLSAASIHLIALGITLLSESCGVMMVAAWIREWRLRSKEILFIVLAVNLVTHTIFWYTLPLLPGEALLRLLVCEIVIVVIEGSVYAYFLHISLWSSLVLSGLLNWVSYTLTVLIWLQIW